ncbi:hypothetical protein LTR64_003613 [Lithohypha guttulata]|uniref:uncharacterized protein n=1 Tax=Lithohypha guttulata TaxID=1690604 RepID=UPI002DE054C7|nr:hypothetical protein LTR51_000167 [Lithohypha guttulata]
MSNGHDDVSERSPLLRDGSLRQQPQPSDDTEQQLTHTSADEHDANAALVDEPPIGRKILIMSSLWVGVFFAALDTTVVATLITPISSSLSSLSLLSYLATGYLIANSACQPLSGKLTDIFSRRTGLVFSNVFFAIGTLICGLAPNAEVLILGRVIAGIGGGGLSCIATFVTSDLIPLRKRGVWQGYGNLVFGAGMGFGGIFGGLCADRMHIHINGQLVEGWRWAFLIQVPFIVVSAILVYFLVNIPVRSPYKSLGSALRRVDFLGALLLIVTVTTLLLGLNTGGNQLPWSHPLVIAALVVSILSFLLFVYIESNPRIVPEPIIPVVLIGRTRTILCACLTNWFATMSAFLALYFVPLYLQSILSYSSSEAGLRVVPFAIAVSAGSLTTGYTMRSTGRYYWLAVGTMTIYLIGSALLCTFNRNTPSWTTFVYVTPLGWGYGGMLTITLVAMISAAAHEHQAVITAASYAFRSTGSTIGITIASAVFQNILTKELHEQYGGLPGAEDTIRQLRNSLEGLKNGYQLPNGWSRDVVLDCYMDALRGAFISGLGLAVLSGVAALGMKEHRLHSKLDRKDDDAAGAENDVLAKIKLM